MPAAVRITDGTTGVCEIGSKCCPHSRNGSCSDGSANVIINGLSAHRFGDSGSCNCAHGGSFTTQDGASSVIINSLPAARLGDATVCQGCGQQGRIIDGSPNVFIESG